MSQTKIKVAVVDNDASFAGAIDRLLRASGFEVQTCAPGDLSKTKIKLTTFENTKLNTVKLNWKEVCFEMSP